MATPLTDGINALTAYANEVTGVSDTTLSDAVESLVAGYGGVKVYSGTYTPSSSSAAATIDTRATGWSHFLIVPHVLPYATSYVRCLGCKYVDFSTRYYLNTFGASSASDIPSACRTVTDDTSPSLSATVQVNGTSITFTGLIASQGGSFQAGTQYDWYAW